MLCYKSTDLLELCYKGKQGNGEIPGEESENKESLYFKLEKPSTLDVDGSSPVEMEKE